jgi:hypothetical protein
VFGLEQILATRLREADEATRRWTWMRSRAQVASRTLMAATAGGGLLVLLWWGFCRKKKGGGGAKEEES